MRQARDGGVRALKGLLLLICLLVAASSLAGELTENLKRAGFTALHEATWNGDRDVIRQLVREGADPNVQSDSDITPLHSAAIHNRPNAAETLIELGANIEARDEMGRTPLFLAAEVNSEPTAIL